ncbi:hypothetical protein [Conexibacter sp. CPCC 205706]|uniref:hypothetical protein n=1 Tax=Conexibacter sp. CPCC 205706 TaxID=3064572 RepID=UPI00272A318F|nr:hypothetical protein [Conexibacter sp. CPCC 205706]
MTAILTALALCGAAAAPAIADDASLKRATEQGQRGVKAPLRGFQKALDTLDADRPSSARNVQVATRKLRTAVARYAESVAAEDASSARFARARKALLKGLRTQLAGLTIYDRGIGQLLAGKAEQARRTLKAAGRKFDQSVKQLEGAEGTLIAKD